MSIFGKPSGGAGGAGDGTNRYFEFTSTSIADEVVTMEAFPGMGTQPCALYVLHDSTDGDELTLIIDGVDETSGAFNTAFVIPPTFKNGVLTVKSSVPYELWLVTDAVKYGPWSDGSFIPVPGAARIVNGGTTQFNVSTTETADSTLTQLFALGTQVLPIETHSVAIASGVATGTLFDFTIPASFNSVKLLDWTAPSAVAVYADNNVSLQLEVFSWNAGTRSWDTVGDYSWTTQADGTPNFGTLTTTVNLPWYDAASHGYRQLPDNGARIKLSATAFEGEDTPTFIHAAISIKTTLKV